MKVSDFIARYLEYKGVSHIFELAGGMICHLIDSISRTQVALVSCHHEQAGAFAAEGHARITGGPGIALATSGPGATNLLTAIGSCYYDSTPAVFITGQVNTHELKGERSIRQMGFQETDIVTIARPICKTAVQLRNAEEVPAALEEAFRISLEGRQGPCLLDIPMNVQSEEINEALALQWLEKARLAHSRISRKSILDGDKPGLESDFVELLSAIREAERPLMLMGGGCAAVNNRYAAQGIVEILSVPVVLSLMAVDLLPESHPLRVGFIGSYGNRWANKALGEADLLIVIGSRLDVKQTGSDLTSFCEGKRIWQIDIDSAEMGVRVQAQHKVCCSISSAANHLYALTCPPKPQRSHWLDHIDTLRLEHPAASEYSAEQGEVNPIKVLQSLSQLSSSPCHYITDVGQHQMWAAQSLRFGPSDRFITSGGMGAMGFGLPAAIGAAMANRDVITILITGDGSFQLNIQELETIHRNRLDIKIVLFNNHCYGMVRQFQEAYFNGHTQSTVKGYSAPDFVAVSKAYSVPACRIESTALADDNLRWLLHQQGPSLLEVPISIGSKVYPKLAFGRRFGSMEPEDSPIDIARR